MANVTAKHGKQNSQPHLRTSIGNSPNTKLRSKHRSRKAYRGQGK